MVNQSTQEIRAFFQIGESYSDKLIEEEIDVLDIDKSNKLGYKRYVFENLVFNKLVCFSNIKLDSGSKIEFNHCTFNDEFAIENLETNEIYFNKCTFKNTVILSKIKSKSIWFKGCSSDLLGLYESEIRSGIFIKSSTINILRFNEISCHRFEIKTDFKTIKEIEFHSCDKINYLEIDAITKVGHLYIGEINTCRLKGNFNEIQLFSEIFKNIELGNIDESVKSKVDKLIYQSRSFEGALILQNLHITSLNFANLNSNKGSVRFTNLEIAKTSLLDVSISSFIWNNVILKDEVYFKRCDFSGLKPNNVSWLKDRKLSPDYISKKYDKNDLIEMRYQRDMYRQLKIAYENNKDKIESLAFYRNEMRLYWKEIKNTDRFSKNSFWEHFQSLVYFFQNPKKSLHLIFSFINHS